MRITPDYNRQKISITFATTATTSVDTTLTEPNLLHSILVVGHTWPAAEAAASGASGCIVSILDSDGRTIHTFTEVGSGATVKASGDIMVFPNDVIRYSLSTAGYSTNAPDSCVSGTTATATDGTYNLPTATVILYKY